MDPLITSKLRPLLPRSTTTTLKFTRNTATSSYSTPPPPQNLMGVATTNRPSSMKKQAKTVPSRWCPTPQQVHTLREMYRSGLQTPTMNQIEQIASWLARFGKIEGKNVFYWFQNHKARERQKLRPRLRHHRSFPPQQQMAPAFLQESATTMNRQVASESSASGNREPSRQHHHRGTTARTPPGSHSAATSDINAMNQNEDSQTLELFPLLSNGRRRSTLGLCNIADSDSTTNSTVFPTSQGSPEINRRSSSPTQFFFEFFPIKN